MILLILIILFIYLVITIFKKNENDENEEFNTNNLDLDLDIKNKTNNLDLDIKNKTNNLDLDINLNNNIYLENNSIKECKKIKKKVLFNLDNNKYYSYLKDDIIKKNYNFYNRYDNADKLFINEFNENLNNLNQINNDELKFSNYNELINNTDNEGKKIGEIYDSLTQDKFSYKCNLDKLKDNDINYNLYNLNTKYNNFDNYSI